MTIPCVLPDGDIGVALRLSGFLQCQAQALGESGFQALAGGPIVAGMLSGLVTIFVALIGYRFILGTVPDLRDGIGWAVRLGMVLTLATGWPAFQTLIYRVAVEAPQELAAVLLAATGLPTDGLDTRVQQAYDTIRLGSTVNTALRAQPSPEVGAGAGQPQTQTPGVTMQPQTPSYGPLGQTALPQTASWFVVSTLGVTGALQLAAGFLLAIGPLAIMALLFDATLGLFVGWIRGLASAVLALLAGTIVTALDLLLVESELAHLQSVERGVSVIDPQGLTTIVLAFTLVMLAAVWAAARTAGGFRLSFARTHAAHGSHSQSSSSERFLSTTPVGQAAGQQRAGGIAAPLRAQSVADALAGSVRREQVAISTGIQRATGDGERRQPLTQRGRDDPALPPTALGPAGRRSIGRKARSTSRRDGII
jgi:type IV secretion system protein VirB6